jgi:two-component system sensor histidine kinase DegS
LAETRTLTERTISEIRRLIAALSPAVLEQLGLPAALRQIATRLRRFHGMEVRVRTANLVELPDRVAAVVYRLIQECANNIARHSSAGCVNISAVYADGRLRLRVADDGVGFRIEEVSGKSESHGLAGMRERVALFRGEFQVQSRPRKGTQVLIELPVTPESDMDGTKIPDCPGRNRA